MWRFLLLLLSLFVGVSLPARTSLTDSLQAVLANTEDEAVQLPVLGALCRIYSEEGGSSGSPAELWKAYLGLFQLFSEKQDTAQANRYATLAHQQVQGSPIRSDRGHLLFQLLQYYFQTGQFEKMGAFQQLWDEYKREQKPDEDLMQQPAHIALYMFATQEEAAVEAQLKKAIQYFEQSGIPYRAGWCYEDLAKLYYKQGNRGAAEQAMQQALSYYREAHVPYRRGRALNRLYRWKKERGATVEALAYLEAYEALEDSLTNVTVEQNLNALRVKAETEKNWHNVPSLFQTMPVRSFGGLRRTLCHGLLPCWG